MPRLLIAHRVRDDYARIAAHLKQAGGGPVAPRISFIKDALRVLTHSPGIGRPHAPDPRLRELVIGHGRLGYVALYRHEPLADCVVVLALRSQREARFKT